MGEIEKAKQESLELLAALKKTSKDMADKKESAKLMKYYDQMGWARVELDDIRSKSFMTAEDTLAGYKAFNDVMKNRSDPVALQKLKQYKTYRLDQIICGNRIEGAEKKNKGYVYGVSSAAEKVVIDQAKVVRSSIINDHGMSVAEKTEALQAVNGALELPRSQEKAANLQALAEKRGIPPVADTNAPPAKPWITWTQVGKLAAAIALGVLVAACFVPPLGPILAVGLAVVAHLAVGLGAALMAVPFIASAASAIAMGAGVAASAIAMGAGVAATWVATHASTCIFAGLLVGAYNYKAVGKGMYELGSGMVAGASAVGSGIVAGMSSMAAAPGAAIAAVSGWMGYDKAVDKSKAVSGRPEPVIDPAKPKLSGS